MTILRVGAFILHREGDDLDEYVQLIFSDNPEFYKLDSPLEAFRKECNKEQYPAKLIKMATFLNLLHKAISTEIRPSNQLLFASLIMDKEVWESIEEY